MFTTILFPIVLVLTFLFTVLISHRLIPILKSKKMGQKILDIGPRWHKGKEGTPTMGGLAFIAASVIVTLLVLAAAAIFGDVMAYIPLLCVMGYALLNGMIGVIDDRAKLRRKQNEGLTAKQKFLLQLAAAALFLAVMRLTGQITTAMRIPFTDISVELGVFYYIISLFLLTGIVNSVNLTDGIDGLASGVTLVVGGFFAAAAHFALETVSVSLSAVGAMMIGAALGFLVYNFYPARVFMGDTGSLFFGGMVVGAAFAMGNPLLVVVFGIVYICETASVMLQVSYFKLTHGKRLFRMAPIHHHFEQCGWSEIRIVVTAMCVTLLFGILAWFGI